MHRAPPSIAVRVCFERRQPKSFGGAVAATPNVWPPCPNVNLATPLLCLYFSYAIALHSGPNVRKLHGPRRRPNCEQAGPPGSSIPQGFGDDTDTGKADADCSGSGGGGGALHLYSQQAQGSRARERASVKAAKLKAANTTGDK